MTTLVWGLQEDKAYEAGIDRGVLFLSGSPGVVWNGLTSISYTEETKQEPIYYSGRKIHDVVNLGELTGVLKAYSAPDSFRSCCGQSSMQPGVYARDQRIVRFGFSYRSMINNEDYRLHILYNLTAIPGERSYTTVSDSATPVEFSWEIKSTPIELAGHRPASAIAIDSRTASPAALHVIEETLYGTDISEPFLMSLDDVLAELG